MDILAAKKTHRQIRAYNLMDTLMQRLEIVINEGVAKTTVYKAFREGGITPTLEIILEQAQATIAEHEAAIQHRLNMLAEPAEA